MSNPSHRLPMLDALRGLAALSVCWFHFTNGNAAFLPDGWLKSSGVHGDLGVQVFFVISGFIIPYSLQRAGYRLTDFGVFLAKRLIRLEPPYLVGLVIVIALFLAGGATPGFHGPRVEISLPQVALHLGYLNVFSHYPWLNPVYWTLAIELQYYLLIGLSFGWVASPSAWVRAAVFTGWGGLASALPSDKFLPHWLFVFMLGVVVFQFHSGILSRRTVWWWLLAVGGGAWWINGALVTAVAVGTALLLAFLPAGSGGILTWFGHISYSLYLLHVPIGGRVINLGLRFVHSFPEKVAVLAAALAVSTGAAWVLYRLVELPAQRWSSSIRYRRSGTPGVGEMPPTSADAISS